MKKWLLWVPSALICVAALPYDPGPARALQEGPWKAPAWADTLKNPFAEKAAAIAMGKESYDLFCWSCHGNKGKGDGAAGASFPIKPADFTSPAVRDQSDGAIYWKLTTGRGNMTPYEDLLTDEQRWELVSYIRVLSRGGEE